VGTATQPGSRESGLAVPYFGRPDQTPIALPPRCDLFKCQRANTLGAKECLIPIDTIRDSVSWFGVVVALENQKMLLARKGPDRHEASLDYHMDLGREVIIPHEAPTRNESLDGIKLFLDSLSGLSSLGQSDRDIEARLSFRDVCHLVFQSQDVVANQSVLFYKGHELKYRLKLQDWFPYLLGIKSENDLLVEKQIHDLEETRNELAKEQRRLSKVAKAQCQQLSGTLNLAREFGLYDGDIPLESSLDALIEIAKAIIQSPSKQPEINTDAFQKAEETLQAIETRRNQLDLDISKLRQRISDIDTLRRTREQYKHVIESKTERLGISDWFGQLFEHPSCCPFCGSDAHPLALRETESIRTAVSKYKRSLSSAPPVLRSFDKEYAALKRELREKRTEMEALEGRADVERKNNEILRNLERTNRKRWEFLGELKGKLSFYEAYGEDGNLAKQLASVDAELTELRKKLPSPNELEFRKQMVEACIAGLACDRLKTLDVDPRYTRIGPRFSYNDLTIRVTGSDNAEHILAEIGSASNWLSFHLAIVCALQEFFATQRPDPLPVPAFVVFDQPSQVYFPHGYQEGDDFASYANSEDMKAVRKIFETISQSIKATDGAWQAIVLEHADQSVYGDVDSVHEIENWRDGDKLIPKNWLENGPEN
jgi:hypothetical protein